MNSRAGQNFKKIADALTVFSAAGWKTDVEVKMYGGHAVEMATKAAERRCDVIIAYGGDGTINQVVNGVIGVKRKGQQGIVGVLPGGTVNQWAAETSLPLDPVKAALALIDSNVCTVDIGRIQVQGLRFPKATQEDHTPQKKGKKVQKRKAEQSARGKHYFLLTAGLGIDASVINHTSKTLKQRTGRFAFDLAAAEVLPTQHPFHIEVSFHAEDGQKPTTWWRVLST